jgi:hypothetical protein
MKLARSKIARLLVVTAVSTALMVMLAPAPASATGIIWGTILQPQCIATGPTATLNGSILSSSASLQCPGVSAVRMAIGIYKDGTLKKSKTVTGLNFAAATVDTICSSGKFYQTVAAFRGLVNGQLFSGYFVGPSGTFC